MKGATANRLVIRLTIRVCVCVFGEKRGEEGRTRTLPSTIAFLDMRLPMRPDLSSEFDGIFSARSAR